MITSKMVRGEEDPNNPDARKAPKNEDIPEPHEPLGEQVDETPAANEEDKMGSSGV